MIRADSNQGLEIFWASGSPMAWPVQMALIEKGLPHRSTCLQLAEGESKSAAFLALNPRGKVPLLRDGGVAVYESRAILEYLDISYPEKSLTPVEPRSRTIELIRRQETSYIYPAADPAISYTSYSSTLARNEWDLERLKTLSRPLITEFERWDHYLRGRTWLAAGEQPTQSDLLLAAQLLYMRRFGFDYRGVGLFRLADYVSQLLERPAVQQTWPPHWQTTEGDPTFAAATARPLVNDQQGQSQ